MRSTALASGFRHRCLVAAVLAALPLPAYAVDLIAQPAALDQPQINVSIYLPDSTDPTRPSLTPQSYTYQDFLTGENVTTINIPAYFDTGASGTLLAGDTAVAFNLPYQSYTNPTTLATTPVKFGDVGAVGMDYFDVSQPIYMKLAPTHPSVDVESPTAYTLALPPMRVQIGKTTVIDENTIDINDLGLQSFDLVGTPAMAGRVVVMNPRPVDAALALNDPNGDPLGAIGDLTSLSMNTFVYAPHTPFTGNTADPGIPTTSHHVKLTYGNFAPYTTVTPSEAAAAGLGPNLHTNPMIGPSANPVLTDATGKPVEKGGIRITLGTASTEGNFLLDTGAGASFISSKLAGQLGITVVMVTEPDPTDPNATVSVPKISRNGQILPDNEQLSIAVQGVGGMSTLAGFYLDELLLRTMEANGDDASDANLRFLHAPVFINDVTLGTGNDAITLDGIFGMNFLVASMNFDATDLFGVDFSTIVPGSFNWIVFDEPNGILGLDVKAELVPEPASLGLLAVGALALLRRRR